MSRSRAELNTYYGVHLMSTYYVPGPRYSMRSSNIEFPPPNSPGKVLLSHFISKKTADQEIQGLCEVPVTLRPGLNFWLGKNGELCPMTTECQGRVPGLRVALPPPA